YHDLCANIAADPPGHLLSKYQLALHCVAEVFDRMSGVIDCPSCGRAIVMLKTPDNTIAVDRTSLPTVFSRNDPFSQRAGHISHADTCLHLANVKQARMNA